MAINFKKAKRAAAEHGIDLGLLTREDGIADGTNLGGAFRCPPEVNPKAFATSFVPETEVGQSTKRSVLMGTDISAPGWSLWSYPEDHPQAGKPHTVVSNKVTYVLMVRPLDVQEAVNFAYGERSRELMTAEVQGETVAGNAPDDSGIITEERLSQIPTLRRERDEMRQEQERDERAGRQTAVFSNQRPKGKTISSKKIKVSK